MKLAAATWKPSDGPPMVDYSSQQQGARKGAHALTLDAKDFRAFLRQVPGDCDVMLEVKDKERSAMRALQILHSR
ncbi:MAG: hypothetical protein V1735_05930 [Nanoarchaeota archaeon]